MKKVTTIITIMMFAGFWINPAGATSEIKTCNLTITNNHSEHAGTFVKVSSDVETFIIKGPKGDNGLHLGVEYKQGMTIEREVEYNNISSVDFQVFPGPGGVSSLKVDEISCKKNLGKKKAMVTTETTTSGVITSTVIVEPIEFDAPTQPAEPAEPAKPIKAMPNYNG